MLERDVVPGVHRVGDAGVNWYLIEDEDGVTIVDAGLPASWASLKRALDAIGRTFGDLRALLLTHGHFDHVGFARRAQQELALAVHCHPADFGVASHPLHYDHERSPLRYAARVKPLLVLGQMLLAGAPITRGVHQLVPLEPGQVVEVPGRPHVIATPGHTYGHVSFHLPERDVLIAGDAVVTLDPYTAQPGPRLVARAATADSAMALASLDAIAATGASVVLTGHGDPWSGGAEEAARLARAAGIA